MSVPLPVEPAAPAVPTGGVASSSGVAPWAAQPLGFLGKAGLVARVILGVVFTPFFVAFAVGLHQFNVVIVLVLILIVIAFLGSGEGLLNRFPALGRVKLLGPTLRVTNDLDAFYREHKPRTFLLYAIYPLYALVGLVASKVVRREVFLHFKVILVVGIVLVFEALATYSSTYPPYLGLEVAASMLAIQLIMVLLISTTYLMPMLTTTYTLGLSGKKKTLRAMVVVSLLLSAGMGYATWVKSSELLPPLDQQRLNARLATKEFRKDLDELVEMFLDHADKRGWLHPKEGGPRVDSEGTDRFRRYVRGMVHGVEYRSFDVISFDVNGDEWTGVRAFLGKRVILLYLRGPDGKLQRNWTTVPRGVKKLFRLGVSSPQRVRAEIVTGGLLHDLPLR